MRPDFNDYRRQLLPQILSLLPQWLPSGKRIGDEWVALNPTRSDKSLGSFKVNLKTGYWADFNMPIDSGHNGTNLLDLYAYVEGHPKDISLAYQKLTGNIPQSTLAPRIIEPEEKHPEPVPTDTPAPRWMIDKCKPSLVHEYRTIDDRLLGYVMRIDLPATEEKPKGDKTYRKLFHFGDDKWHYKGFKGANKPIYNVQNLPKNPNARVMITEGEKACDAAQRMLPDWVCLSMIDGVGAISKADLTPLKGRECVLWPDNDTPGRKAMARLSGALKPIVASVAVMDFRTVKEKWDLADAEAEGWTREQVLTVIDTDVMPDEIPSAITGTITDNDYYLYLGSHDTDDKNSTEYYFLSRIDDNIKKLKESQFAPLKLTNIAPERWWLSFRRRKQDGNPEGKESWMVNIINLIREESGVRRFHPEKIRGVGVWRESGESDGFVFHVGNQVISSDAVIPFGKAKSGFIYCSENAIPIAEDEAPVEATQMLSQVIQLASWAHPTHALLLIGWMFISPVASVMKWRPHIYLWGPAHSGKTTMLGFINQYLSDFLISKGSKSTEPGIRGLIGNTGKPVLLDEAEDYGPTERLRLDNILNLITGASSGRNDTGIVKGTATGGVKLYSCNSVFCLASINPCLKETAHLERFAQLRMTNKGENRAEKWKQMQTMMADFDYQYPDFQKQLRRRAFNRLPQLLEIIDLFSDELGRNGHDSRISEHIGGLMAGYWLMNNNESPSVQDVADLVKVIDLTENTEEEGGTEHDKLINILLRHTVSYIENEGENSFRAESTIGELIYKVAEDKNAGAKEVLKRKAINVNIKSGLTYIANHSVDLQSIFKGTLGANNWSKILAGFDGAVKNVSQRFEGGELKPVQKCIGLPTEMLIDFARDIHLIEDDFDYSPTPSPVQSNTYAKPYNKYDGLAGGYDPTKPPPNPF